MRQLHEITDAVRRNEAATEEELRLAVCAYDVLMVQLELDRDPKQLAKFFTAAEASPEDYIGPQNDPRDPKVAAWHRAFINVG
ncbi:MAG: hypothetical protein CMH18_07805 [Methylophaga sp.]|uniref:hypothetical protein n=1 Tax=Methylophaga sp. TaxID=2024840 RepID=UPI000C8F0970|nr:hypothetical protein [Methylophaga sp.]MAL49648.1 hypothetical protein [Methylophaga sp.]|tara:strand:+ start:2089 stop:2337 length:249 start_codon:yes stop_codon:yes gene_type:complete